METSTKKEVPCNEGKKCMRAKCTGGVSRMLSLALIMLSIFLFAVTLKTLKEYSYVGSGVAPTTTISVSGEGEAFALPDTAEFTFSIEEKAPTVVAAQDAVAKKMEDALAVLTENGVKEKDIKTIAYNLQPKYAWEPPRCTQYPCDREWVQTGFVLNETVRVKVRDLDRAGEVLGNVTAVGVQHVSSLTFTVADEDAVKDEARANAIKQAKEKAKTLARDLGVTLVRVVDFSEAGEYQPVPVYRATTALVEGDVKSATTPVIPTGENHITSRVTVVYEIR